MARVHTPTTAEPVPLNARRWAALYTRELCVFTFLYVFLIADSIVSLLRFCSASRSRKSLQYLQALHHHNSLHHPMWNDL